MKVKENPFMHLIPDGFYDKDTYLEKYLVKTDLIKFFNRYYKQNPRSINFIIEGGRGSGKTSCLLYLKNLLSNDKKNFVVFYNVPLYQIMMHRNSDFFNTSDVVFLLPIYRGLFHTFFNLNIKDVDVRENKLQSFFSNQKLRKEEFNGLKNYVLSDTSAILEKISENYKRAIFLVDGLDKFPFSNLKNISTSNITKIVQQNSPKPLDVTYVCSSSKETSLELFNFLRRLTQKETIITNTSWDLGYLTEAIRRRIEESTDRQLKDCFDDDSLFKLYKITDNNPRAILNELYVLWEKVLKNKKRLSLSDFNNVFDKSIEVYTLSKKIQIDREKKFKLMLLSYWERVLTAKTNKDKGKALESLFSNLFESVVGLTIRSRNIRTSCEEIDIIIINEANDVFLRELGTPIIVECKNWNRPIGAKDVSWFISKVKKRSLKVGILIAMEGITGDEYKDANLEIKNALAEGITIVVITKDELRKIYSPNDFLYVLKECFYKPYEL